ncbi:MAG: metallophosphoesterase [Bacillota bacterium]|nr:metallophosphoesterase [Bacillota bacterium]
MKFFLFCEIMEEAKEIHSMVVLTGDIHGKLDSTIEFIKEQQLGPNDILILLGDVGLNFWGNRNGDAKNKRKLNDKGVQILCIHGNHEMRPESIKTYKEYEWHGGKVYREPAYPNLNFAKDGEVYDLEGKTAIAIGGAYSIDKFYRLMTYGYWWSDEQPSPEIKARVEHKLNELNWKVDIVLSHTCPAKYIPVEAFMPGLSQENVDRSTEDWLDSIEEKLSYNAWYCGHWHINKRIDKMHFLMECHEMLR